MSVRACVSVNADFLRSCTRVRVYRIYGAPIALVNMSIHVGFLRATGAASGSSSDAGSTAAPASTGLLAALLGYRLPPRFRCRSTQLRMVGLLAVVVAGLVVAGKGYTRLIGSATATAGHGRLRGADWGTGVGAGAVRKPVAFRFDGKYQ